VEGRDGKGKKHIIGSLSDAEREKRGRLEERARVERLKDNDKTTPQDLEIHSRRRVVNDPKKS